MRFLVLVQVSVHVIGGVFNRILCKHLDHDISILSSRDHIGCVKLFILISIKASLSFHEVYFMRLACRLSGAKLLEFWFKVVCVYLKVFKSSLFLVCRFQKILVILMR